jgi:hypothetical protein
MKQKCTAQRDYTLMDTQNTTKKSFNLPSYINIPFFLYQDDRLDKSSMLIAAFFYSLCTAGKKITASSDYMCQLVKIKKRQYYYILDLLEKCSYIKRHGHTNRRILFWTFNPQYSITLTENDTNALDCTSVQELNTSAVDCSKLVQSSALNLCTPLHTYIKEDIKEDTTTSSSINFDQYKKQENENLERANIEYSKQQRAEQFKKEALADEQCLAVFNERFKNISVSLDRLYEDCCDYWSQNNQMVYKSRFLTHLKKTPIEKYMDIKTVNKEKNFSKSTNNNQYIDKNTQDILRERKALKDAPRTGQSKIGDLLKHLK